MSNEKTYTGQHSFHEMLIRAQGLSPPLTYVLCKLLLNISLEEEKDRLVMYSRKISPENLNDEFAYYFSKEFQHCRFSRFLNSVFSGHTVMACFVNSHTQDRCISADRQFLQWLQSGVVTVDNELKLVTIHL